MTCSSWRIQSAGGIATLSGMRAFQRVNVQFLLRSIARPSKICATLFQGRLPGSLDRTSASIH